MYSDEYDILYVIALSVYKDNCSIWCFFDSRRHIETAMLIFKKNQ